MSYVIYDVNTTRFMRILRQRYWQDAVYSTQPAAYAGLTRAARKAHEQGKPFDTTQWAIAEKSYFHDNIEKQETRKNLLSGQDFTQPVNTPACCDPSTETYHCM